MEVGNLDEAVLLSLYELSRQEQRPRTKKEVVPERDDRYKMEITISRNHSSAGRQDA